MASDAYNAMVSALRMVVDLREQDDVDSPVDRIAREAVWSQVAHALRLASEEEAFQNARPSEKSLDDMTEPELRDQIQFTCTVTKLSLPPDTGFIVLCAPFGKHGIAQYGSNVQKEDSTKWMVETLTRWGAGDYIPRVGT